MTKTLAPKKEVVPVAWVTKYALSAGVKILKDGEYDGDGMLSDHERYRSNYHGKDWHRTESAAQVRVLDMIAAKRKSIRKQLTKLDAYEKKVRMGKMMEAE